MSLIREIVENSNIPIKIKTQREQLYEDWKSVALKIATLGTIAYWGIARLKSTIDSRAKIVVDSILKSYKPKASDITGKISVSGLNKTELDSYIARIVKERIRVEDLLSKVEVKSLIKAETK